jgi:hypothetical protein
MTVPTVVTMPKKNPVRATAGMASGKARPKRPKAPWGKFLGGKPIERNAYIGAETVDLSEVARQIQYDRMVLLLRSYNIVDHVPNYPIAGVGDTGWWCWYQLALAIAAGLDDSLKIVDAKPPGKTEVRWAGTEGRLLLKLVKALKESRPKRSVDWCLSRLQKVHPEYYGQMPLKHLKARYYDAMKYHRGTKRAPNSGRAS